MRGINTINVVVVFLMLVVLLCGFSRYTVSTRSCLNLSKLIHHNYASASMKNGDCIFIDFMLMIYGTVKSFEYIYMTVWEIQRDASLRNVNYIGILAHMDGLSIDKSSLNGRTWHLNVAL